MIFTSYEFVFFFVAVIIFRSCFQNFNAEKWFLLAASYTFFITWSITGVLLLLCTSIVNYLVGLYFIRFEDGRRRKLLLGVSVAVNLGVLFFFKYISFFIDNVWWIFTSFGFHEYRMQYDISLPVGISFFTFIGMTYTIEIYKRNLTPCQSPRDVLLFMGFFPQILAGPINRAVDLIPQFQQRVRATAIEFESGLVMFALGAVKKMVISDRVAPHVDLIFANPGNYDGFTLLQGLLGYAVQIYCDFSGYSDMAIGCACMMGFRFTENFQMPYSAVNITEFWRRWHISLSTWFRDYLYIPLGGSRKGSARTYMNLILTMLLCGLWHGASWTFVFWGGFHGVSLAIHRAWKAWDPLSSVENQPGLLFVWTLFSRLLTIGVVLLGWLFFRAQSWRVAGLYLRRILTWSHDGTKLVSPYIIFAVIAVFMIHLILKKDCNWAQEIPLMSISTRIVNYVFLALLIVSIGATGSSPFIYFQF